MGHIGVVEQLVEFGGHPSFGGRSGDGWLVDDLAIGWGFPGALLSEVSG